MTHAPHWVGERETLLDQQERDLERRREIDEWHADLDRVYAEAEVHGDR